jgi:hypothetical protein
MLCAVTVLAGGGGGDVGIVVRAGNVARPFLLHAFVPPPGSVLGLPWVICVSLSVLPRKSVGKGWPHLTYAFEVICGWGVF